MLVRRPLTLKIRGGGSSIASITADATVAANSSAATYNIADAGGIDGFSFTKSNGDPVAGTDDNGNDTGGAVWTDTNHINGSIVITGHLNDFESYAAGDMIIIPAYASADSHFAMSISGSKNLIDNDNSIVFTVTVNSNHILLTRTNVSSSKAGEFTFTLNFTQDTYRTYASYETTYNTVSTWIVADKTITVVNSTVPSPSTCTTNDGPGYQRSTSSYSEVITNLQFFNCSTINGVLNGTIIPEDNPSLYDSMGIAMHVIPEEGGIHFDHEFFIQSFGVSVNETTTGRGDCADDMMFWRSRASSVINEKITTPAEAREKLSSGEVAYYEDEDGSLWFAVNLGSRVGDDAMSLDPALIGTKDYSNNVLYDWSEQTNNLVSNAYENQLAAARVSLRTIMVYDNPEVSNSGKIVVMFPSGNVGTDTYRNTLSTNTGSAKDKYTWNYDANTTDEYTGTTNSSSVIEGGSMSIANNGYSRDGYVFLYWNTEPDGTGTTYKAGDVVTPSSDETLYAQWYELPESRTPVYSKTVTQSASNPNDYTISLTSTGASYSEQSPMNIVFILDRTGSVGEDSWDKIRSAVKAAGDYMTTVGGENVLVTAGTFTNGYRNGTEIVVPLSNNPDWSELDNSILSTMEVEGPGTSYKEAADVFNNIRATITNDYPTRIIFFSDGEPSDYNVMLPYWQTIAADDNNTIDIVALNNVSLLQRMATALGASYKYSSTAAGLSEIIQQSVSSLIGVPASNLTITDTLSKWVTPATTDDKNRPVITVTGNNGAALTENTDYTYSYNASTRTLKVTRLRLMSADDTMTVDIPVIPSQDAFNAAINGNIASMTTGDDNTGDFSSGKTGYPSNDSAALSYEKINGGSTTSYSETFPVPVIQVYTATIAYQPNTDTYTGGPQDDYHGLLNSTTTVAEPVYETTAGCTEFTGWNTKADGTGTSYQPGDTINLDSETITLHAQWVSIPCVPPTGTITGRYTLGSDTIHQTPDSRLSGVIVNLYKADDNGSSTGELVASTTADSAGYYSFDGLPINLNCEYYPNGTAKSGCSSASYIVEYSRPLGVTLLTGNNEYTVTISSDNSKAYSRVISWSNVNENQSATASILYAYSSAKLPSTGARIILLTLVILSIPAIIVSTRVYQFRTRV